MERNATYVSVWDGGIEIRSGCHYNPETREVSNIEVVDVNVEVLEDEFLIFAGEIYRKFEIID